MHAAARLTSTRAAAAATSRAPPPAARRLASSSRAAAAACAPTANTQPPRPARRPHRVMAFLTEDNERLAGLGRRFVQTWGSVATRGLDAASTELRELVAPDAVFHADGVVYEHDLQGLPAILEALAREHRVYEHTIYQPVAVAANEDDGVVFVGVAWEFKNTGPVFGANVASGSVSRGFSIKQLTFDADGKLTSSRVNRQMTTEEQQALVNPGVKCQPADVFGDVLPRLGTGAQQESEKPSSADADLAGAMRNSLMTWVQCWSSEGADLEQLNKVLAPDVFAYDAYGLHHAADKPGREGHAVSLMGRQDARASIQALHAKFRDRNKLLAFAVDPQARVAFDHWRGEAVGRDDPSARFVVEGVDMLLFNEEGQITVLVQFDQQDYGKLLRANVRRPAVPASDAPAGSGSAS